MSRKVKLINANKFMVPVSLKQDGELVQVNMYPMTTMVIDRKEITSIVNNLTSGPNKVLTMKRV